MSPGRTDVRPFIKSRPCPRGRTDVRPYGFFLIHRALARVEADIRGLETLLRKRSIVQEIRTDLFDFPGDLRYNIPIEKNENIPNYFRER